MPTMYKIRLLSAMLLVFMFCTVMFITPVYGVENDYYEDTYTKESNSSMVVNATWLDGDMLRIDVLDTQSGSVSSLAVRLSDFVANADYSPYILIQAVDLYGNLSGVVQISNPLYIPMLPISDDTLTDSTNIDDYEEVTEPPQLGLTPDGTGTVVDNIVTQNEIEFFTVFTEAGNEFFLVIDRQSNTDNVHLLNAVTEADLMALAQNSGNPIEPPTPPISAIPPIEELLPPSTPQPPITPEPEPTTRRNNSNLILILLIVLVAGGAAYYLKVIRPRKEATYDEEDDDYGYHDAMDTEDTADSSESDGDE